MTSGRRGRTPSAPSATPQNPSSEWRLDWVRAAAAVALGLWLTSAQAYGQSSSGAARTVWDLPLGAHAVELPTDAFIDFACGSRGGPPTLTLATWSEFAKCQPEPGTDYREVYFRYDDEPEYIARARSLENQIVVYQYTAVYDVPVIASALFDADGFMVGLRLVTDPRVETAVRENGSSLGGFLKARYGEDQFACEDLPRAEGETEYQGIFIKYRCDAQLDGIDLFIEAHEFRKRGQVAVNQAEGPTAGQFESSTFFEAVLAEEIPNRVERLRALPAPRPSPRDLLAQRAMNCPGCDLRGVDLKRANLTGANLAGADLTGANLHAAILTRSILAGAQLAGANINRADLRMANLSGAVLTGAMLYDSKLDGADLTDANLDGAFASRIQLGGADLAGATLINADLRHARVNDANLAGANLSGALLHDVQMTRSRLGGAIMIQASLWRIGLAGADLSGVDARGADFFGANLRGANLTSADFSYSRLTSANLFLASTAGANFAEAQLPAGFSPPLVAPP